MVIFCFKNDGFFNFLIVIMDGENKISKEEEQNMKKNVDEQNKKNLEKVVMMRDHLDQFFESISKDEL